MRLKYYFGRLLVRLKGLKKEKSYSQVNEDNIIDWLTGYLDKGVYIDIGAFHPDKISNTKLFYERGWRGINIEPDTKAYRIFCEKRPLDINLNVGIGTGEVDYYQHEGDISGNTCVASLGKSRGLKHVRKINLKPLSEVFEENKITYVDFMSIDVETFENEVIRSNDWNKNKAGVICLEGYTYPYLEQFGYKKVFWDGSNSYYKLKESIKS